MSSLEQFQDAMRGVHDLGIVDGTCLRKFFRANYGVDLPVGCTSPGEAVAFMLDMGYPIPERAVEICLYEYVEDEVVYTHWGPTGIGVDQCERVRYRIDSFGAIERMTGDDNAPRVSHPITCSHTVANGAKVRIEHGYCRTCKCIVRGEGHVQRCELPQTAEGERIRAWLGDVLHMLDVRTAILFLDVDAVERTKKMVHYCRGPAQAAYMSSLGQTYDSIGLASRAFEAYYLEIRPLYLATMFPEVPGEMFVSAEILWPIFTRACTKSAAAPVLVNPTLAKAEITLEPGLEYSGPDTPSTDDEGGGALLTVGDDVCHDLRGFGLGGQLGAALSALVAFQSDN